MKRPRRFIQFWVFVMLFCFSYPYSVLAQKNVAQILKKLDATYYYPQRNDLTSLVATVVWEKGFSGNDNYATNPTLKFSWNGNSGKRTFNVAGSSLELPSEEQTRLLQFFSNYKEALLPKTLNEKFSRYLGRASHGNFGTQIVLEIKDFKDGISRYSLLISDKLHHISRMLIDRIEAPTKVAGEFKYIQRDGYWLVSESIARFNLGGQPYEEKTLYYYREIENIWLVNKIDQTLTKDDKKLSRFIFRVKDYLLNWSNN